MLLATITDIARKTGFSPMTVSRVFSDPDKVKPKTREIILNAAEELNFYPNNVARSLAKKCTNIIYVYIPKELSATEQFVSQTVTAIGERLGEHGYSFLLSRNLPKGDGFDGLIMMGLSHDEEREILRARSTNKPVVLYGNSDDFPAWVDVDNYNGAQLAAKYLIDRGRQSIAIIGAPLKMRYAEERLNGYIDCISEHNLDISDNMIIIGDANEQSGYLCTNELLDRDVEIDAIACATDLMAMGCIRALKERNISVPEKISVVGFDGFGHENIISPRLTTVRQPLFEVGVKLADTLISLLEGGNPQRIKISPELKINESA